MDLDAIYHWGVLLEVALALIGFPLLFWITVPYGGRHTSDRWGPTIPSRIAWFLMEIPAPTFLIWGYAQGASAADPATLLLLTAFLVHYAHRAIIYPLKMRSAGKRTPVSTASAALLVNVLNGTINGLALGSVGSRGVSGLGDPFFWLGAAIFVAGAAVNWHADRTLRRLRKPGETGYRVPTGGLYRWVSSPNYLGEIVQWGGLGDGDPVGRGPRVPARHDRQPGPARSCEPALVSRPLLGLPERPAGSDSRNLVAPKSGGKPHSNSLENPRAPAWAP